MSNIVQYKNRMAFHPGYYIKEIIDDSGLTQEDFAKKLNTTPKNISILIHGDQSLSLDIAGKLSRMLGTSVEYWLNLQKTYDTFVAEMQYDLEMEKEKEIFKYLDYKYFTKYFDLPTLPKQTEAQIKTLREFLKIASLSVLANKNLSVNFSSKNQANEIASIVCTNAILQLGINKTIENSSAKYNKEKFKKVVEEVKEKSSGKGTELSAIEEAFNSAGVVLLALPGMPGAKIKGATKKIGSNIMLLINGQKRNREEFWFTVFHEVGHILNGDLGAEIEKESDSEKQADKYAKEALARFL